MEPNYVTRDELEIGDIVQYKGSIYGLENITDEGEVRFVILYGENTYLNRDFNSSPNTFTVMLIWRPKIYIPVG